MARHYKLQAGGMRWRGEVVEVSSSLQSRLEVYTLVHVIMQRQEWGNKCGGGHDCLLLPAFPPSLFVLCLHWRKGVGLEV